ncbi:iduronate sulfatase [Verrucomicrobia bacterium IMCC26134]|jgi:arylsulfatase A-like enzyme|nr:iduronate sulfatase [Verrucomicrobia bacterium IMCC26134]
MKNLILNLVALCATACAYAAPTAKPNVLFIAVDDLRPELGCYGRDHIKSPNIDALARSGIVFERAYVQQAVCSPSRTAVMTGLRPDTTKVWDLVTSFRAAQPDTITLGQAFKNAGYFVQGMGKIYHGKLNDEASWSVPWGTPKADTYALAESTVAGAPKAAGEPDDAAPAAPTKKKKKASEGEDSEGLPKGKGAAYECADVPDSTYTDGKTAELAVTTLGDLAKKDQPFFLAVGFVKPHLPFVSPKKYWDLYDPASITLPENPFYPKDAPSYAIRKTNGEIYAYTGMPAKGEPFSPELVRKLRHGYYAAVSYTDAQIGKVLAELDRLDLRKNTIVILWGDHGWKLGEHNAWCKHSNAENDTNSPLILSAPGMKTPGTRTKALVEFVDIYPTLADLAGIPAPAYLDGTSAKPLLDNPDRPWKNAAYSQYPRSEKGGLMGYSMRTDRYRFTVWVKTSDKTQVDATELYDHQLDPQENVNLAGDPAHAVEVERLMVQWRAGWQGTRAAL